MKLQADLGTIGPSRTKAVNTLRKIMLQDIATNIVDASRAAHINITMGNDEANSRVPGWKQLRAEGHLTEEVAIIVDGSPSRPIRNVKFAGNITIVQEEGVELLLEAAEYAWRFITRFAEQTKGPTSGHRRKGHNMRHHQSFEMYISDKKKVSSVTDLTRDGAVTTDDWITIHNFVPYAAKLERYRLPGGAFQATFRQMRKKYGGQLALRYDHVESTTHTIKGTDGVAVAQPVLRIGLPHLFPTRRANVKKYRRDSIKRGRGPY